MNKNTLYVLAGLLAVGVIVTIAIGRSPGSDAVMTGDVREAQEPLLSADGSLVAVCYHDEHYGNTDGCYVYEIKTGKVDPVAEHLNITQLPKDMAWAPTGKRIAYAQGGRVCVYNAETRRQYDLYGGFEPHWSADGERLFFFDCAETTRLRETNGTLTEAHQPKDNRRPVKETASRLFCCDLKTGAVQPLVGLLGYQPHQRRFGLINDKRISFVADSVVDVKTIERDYQEITPDTVGWNVQDYVFESGQPLPVMFIPRTSPHLRFVAMTADARSALLQDRGAVWVVDIDSNRTWKALDAAVSQLSWQQDGAAFYYCAGSGIWRYQLASRKIQKIGQLQGNMCSVVSSNGVRAVYSAYMKTGFDPMTGLDGHGVLFVKKLE